MKLTDDRWRALVARLFEQNQFSIKLGLDRMRRALDAAGEPDRSAPLVLIAGTNGKGTTSAVLSALLRSAGLRVGLYTSPHLLCVSERFRIDGAPASREDVFEVGLAVMAWFAGGLTDPALQAQGEEHARHWGWGGSPARGDDALTFFELTTLMAALIFERAQVDVILFEVGLGGRLDATNAAEPCLSLIATIDLDHQHILGDTLGAIAAEKAGIMRHGVPALAVAQQPAAAEALAQHAASIQAPLAQLPAPGAGATLSVGDAAIKVALPPWLQGVFASNAQLALHAHLKLVELGIVASPVAPGALGEVLAAARWPGRRDSVRLGGHPWLFDVAHNPAGMGSLLSHLEARDSPPPALGILGVMRDKDLSGILDHLQTLPTTWIPVAADTPRALSADELHQALLDRGVTALAPPDNVRAALAIAQALGVETLVTGSVYLLGDVLEGLSAPAAFFHLSSMTD